MSGSSDSQADIQSQALTEHDEAAAMVPFSWAQQLQFTLKELRETLRDRRTIITLLAMPILLYPLLGLGFRFVALQEATVKRPMYVIATNVEPADGVWIDDEIRIGQAALEQAAMRRAQREQPNGLSKKAIPTARPTA